MIIIGISSDTMLTAKSYQADNKTKTVPPWLMDPTMLCVATGPHPTARLTPVILTTMVCAQPLAVNLAATDVPTQNTHGSRTHLLDISIKLSRKQPITVQGTPRHRPMPGHLQPQH